MTSNETEETEKIHVRRMKNEKKKRKKKDIIKGSTQRMDTSPNSENNRGQKLLPVTSSPLKTVKLACKSYRKWPRWNEKLGQGKHSFSRPVVFE